MAVKNKSVTFSRPKVMELKPKFTRDEIKAALDELNAADYVLCQRQ
jgi:hypothetical protein